MSLIPTTVVGNWGTERLSLNTPQESIAWKPSQTLVQGARVPWAPRLCTLAILRCSQQGGSTGTASREHSTAHPAAPGICWCPPAETEHPVGCRSPGISSLLRRNQQATKSALTARYRWVWVGQLSSPLTGKSPQGKEFKIFCVRGDKVQLFYHHRYGTGRQQPWVWYFLLQLLMQFHQSLLN